MTDNDQNTINVINFTKRCILISVISKEKNLLLINSFHKIPIVKLYTADSSYQKFIYSKIKGAFCLLMTKEKDIKNCKYYFRIYSLKDYSILFNMEVKKEYMQYISQSEKDVFYYMQLRSSFLGFEFLSSRSAQIFLLLLNEDPKEEVLEQNEGAENIKPKDISKTITKVTDYIKARLKYKFESYGSASKTVYTNNKRKDNASKKGNFSYLNVNEVKGEYLDTSVIPDVEVLVNNLEIDDVNLNCYLFTEKNLNLKKCKEIVKTYQTNTGLNKYRRRSEPSVPMTIIDKDCQTIANTDLYVDIMTKNMINNIRTQKRLEIFQKEHKKRHRGFGNVSHKLSRKTKSRSPKIGSSLISNLSKLNPDRFSLNNYNSEKPSSSNYMDIYNATNNSSKKKVEAKSVDKENSGEFANDKRQINSMPKTEVFKEMDDEDEDDNDKGKINYNKNNNRINNIKKGVDVIEERPEDEEKEKDYKQKIKDIKNIKPNNKRVIPGKKGQTSISDFLESKSKK
jgi:hypothetical protein